MLGAIRDFAYRRPYLFFVLIGLAVLAAIYTWHMLDTEQRDDRGRTLLIRAAEDGDQAAVQRLLDRGAAVDAVDDCRTTALMKAAGNDHAAVVDLLLDHGANVHALDKAGYSALLSAAANGRVDTMRLLLARGARVDVQDQDLGWTALIWAAKDGVVDMMQLLLDAGADPGLRDHEGMSALDWAVREQNSQVIEMLLNSLSSRGTDLFSGDQRSLGIKPVRLEIRANIRGPISSAS